MNPVTSFSRWRILAGVSAAFAVGYLAARNSSSKASAAGLPIGAGTEQNSIGFDAGFGGANSRAGAFVTAQWPEVRSRLEGLWEASPGSECDYDLREETRRLLANVPFGLLETWFREINPQVDGGDVWDNRRPLGDFVGEILATRDGAALVRSLAERPDGNSPFRFSGALDTWREHDPAAVLAWLDGDVPEAVRDDLDFHRDNVLLALAWKDVAAFESRLALLESEARSRVLSGVAAEARFDPDRRNVILARAARSSPEEAMALRKGLIEGVRGHDPRLAYQLLAEMEISASDRASLDLDLTASVFRDFAAPKPERGEILDGWLDRNPGDEVPDQILQAMTDWSRQDQEGALAWIGGLLAGARRDAVAQSFAEEQLRSSHPPFPELATVAAGVGDPGLRADLLRSLHSAWAEKDEGAAAVWEATLSESDRNALK